MGIGQVHCVVWSALRSVCCLAVAIALSACGTPTLRPAEIPVGEIRVVAGPEPGRAGARDVGGKGETAATGAVAGGSAAGFAAIIACVPTGFLMPVCLSTLVPTAFAAGAVGGGIAGAVMADDEETIRTKQEFVAEHLAATQPSATLATALRSALGATQGGADDAVHWRAEAQVVGLTAEPGTRDKPFRLVLVSTLTVSGPSATSPPATRRYITPSARAESLDGWRADDGRAFRSALQAMSDEAGARMAEDLRR